MSRWRQVRWDRSLPLALTVYDAFAYGWGERNGIGGTQTGVVESVNVNGTKEARQMFAELLGCQAGDVLMWQAGPTGGKRVEGVEVPPAGFLFRVRNDLESNLAPLFGVGKERGGIDGTQEEMEI